MNITIQNVFGVCECVFTVYMYTCVVCFTKNGRIQNTIQFLIHDVKGKRRERNVLIDMYN